MNVKFKILKVVISNSEHQNSNIIYKIWNVNNTIISWCKTEAVLNGSNVEATFWNKLKPKGLITILPTIPII